MKTQLIFGSIYRFDLRQPDYVVIPNIFGDGDIELIWLAKTKKPDHTIIGRINQILVDYPNKLINGSVDVISGKNQKLIFAPDGRFKLEFFPIPKLGRCDVSISKIVP